MINQANASQVAKAGFDLWQEGRLEEAIVKYRAALECADPNHYALDGYHGECAAVFATLGRNAEAREQYELALVAALRQDSSGTGPGVLIARYFLSEHLLLMGDAAQALAVVQSRPETASRQECDLKSVEARALWQLGRDDESKNAAASAVALAPTEQYRAKIRDDLAFILDRDRA